ncbi:hypothetical protein PR048_004020 [Dryococelus australis]|uniref:Uncharacterized protein n=1 Tax=Dryococelus australis TaxID=614101 RepID=A0ABQ9I4C8_9NEOP|nr:hypothetical protein PR048_004020 [Dryococelus australis]
MQCVQEEETTQGLVLQFMKMLVSIILTSLEDHGHVSALLGYSSCQDVGSRLCGQDLRLTEVLMNTLLQNLSHHTVRKPAMPFPACSLFPALSQLKSIHDFLKPCLINFTPPLATVGESSWEYLRSHSRGIVSVKWRVRVGLFPQARMGILDTPRNPKLQGEIAEYLSGDTVMDTEQRTTYPVEFLNSLRVVRGGCPEGTSRRPSTAESRKDLGKGCRVRIIRLPLESLPTLPELELLEMDEPLQAAGTGWLAFFRLGEVEEQCLNEMEKNLDKGMVEILEIINPVNHLHDLLSSLQMHLLAFCSMHTQENSALVRAIPQPHASLSIRAVVGATKVWSRFRLSRLNWSMDTVQTHLCMLLPLATGIFEKAAHIARNHPGSLNQLHASSALRRGDGYVNASDAGDKKRVALPSSKNKLLLWREASHPGTSLEANKLKNLV